MRHPRSYWLGFAALAVDCGSSSDDAPAKEARTGADRSAAVVAVGGSDAVPEPANAAPEPPAALAAEIVHATEPAPVQAEGEVALF